MSKGGKNLSPCFTFALDGRGVDPAEDTESLRLFSQPQGHPNGRGVDPAEDTESQAFYEGFSAKKGMAGASIRLRILKAMLLQAGFVIEMQMAGASIRLRMLKACHTQGLLKCSTNGRGVDPAEDTESLHPIR